MVGLRAFDGLDADAILDIGWQRLAEEHGGARRRPLARSIRTADVHDGHRPGQGRRTGRLRWRARRLPRRDDPGPGPPDRPRPGHGPVRRAHRGHRDPRVPAQCPAVRGVLRAGRLRSRCEGDLRRHAVGPRRPGRDEGTQLRVDQQHEHPRGVSGPPSAARSGPPPSVPDPDADRGPRVRRGLGDVLGADDARARLRHGSGVPARHAHGRHLASVPDHPRHPDAPRRAQRRRGDRLPRGADELPALGRPGRGGLVHEPPDLSPVLPARPDDAPGAARRTRNAGSGTRSASRRSTTPCSMPARCPSASTAACSRATRDPRPHRPPI